MLTHACVHVCTHRTLQVDPQQEWLAAVALRQPAQWWAWQLEHGRDVLAQASAVAGLSAQAKAAGRGGGAALDRIVAALSAAMRNPSHFCRHGMAARCFATSDGAGCMHMVALCLYFSWRLLPAAVAVKLSAALAVIGA